MKSISSLLVVTIQLNILVPILLKYFNPWLDELGGSTGCVIAGRLANLDPKLTVLLIEGGENNLNNPWVFRPGIYPRNMKLDSRTASFYHSRPSEHLGGRRAIVPCAHVLGGGSSINFMVCKLLKMAVIMYDTVLTLADVHSGLC